MKKYGWIFILLGCFVSVNGKQLLSLEDCRRLALENNKQLSIADETIKKAEADKKAAFTQYLPDISLSAAYMYNHRNISLLDADKYLPIGTVMADGSFGFTPEQINNQWTVINGNAIPLDADGRPFNPAENPSKILWKEHTIIPKEQFELDIHNVFSGSISLVQPIFMGGKIIAYNKIADYAKELAQLARVTNTQEVILQVDQTYWQTISLFNKLRLSDTYVRLLRQMNQDVDAMIEEGVATRADGLSVKVKLNEAEMIQLQVYNGLQLSKMLLCQLCGLPMEEQVELADEQVETIPVHPYQTSGTIQDAWNNRPEVKSLSLANKIYEKKEDLTRADRLPSVALIGNYILSNPNSFNGFQNKFAGTWNVGVMVNVPLFHFGENRHKLQSAQAETRIKQIEMAEAKEKIELQVYQSTYQLQEAHKKLTVANKNKENAEENLRYADLGFKEGVIPTSNVMEAQSVWYKAQSDLIDAQIAIRLGEVELNKAMGTLYNK